MQKITPDRGEEAEAEKKADDWLRLTDGTFICHEGGKNAGKA